MKRTRLAIATLLCISLMGCNNQSIALKSENVLTAVIQVAKAEEPVIPAQDQAIYTNFVNLAMTLDNQLAVCLNGLGTMTKASTFAQCFNAFATGLLSPTELQQLRLLSPGTQNKVILYVTGAVAAINVALAAFSNSQIPVPAIGTAAAEVLPTERGWKIVSEARYGTIYPITMSVVPPTIECNMENNSNMICHSVPVAQ